ncbi:MAG TPA: Lrp/AsnC family transcriptional regulator [Caulobacteraceae bacterium]|nr:Lrp/AsnC family transcriptional regulator [Caulobacteraceae bacterium]
MDDLDHRLVALLRADARTPVSALAKTLKVSRGTVQARIDRMLARGEIAGFTVRASPAPNDARVRAVMTVAIEGEGAGPVIAALRGLPEVAAIHTTNGRWDLVVELDAESLPAFSRLLDAVRLIPGVASTETSLLLSTQRF